LLLLLKALHHLRMFLMAKDALNAAEEVEVQKKT
jgi:hypothetical protein